MELELKLDLELELIWDLPIEGGVAAAERRRRNERMRAERHDPHARG